jgi:hypothetical protein
MVQSSLFILQFFHRSSQSGRHHADQDLEIGPGLQALLTTGYYTDWLVVSNGIIRWLVILVAAPFELVLVLLKVLILRFTTLLDDSWEPAMLI